VPLAKSFRLRGLEASWELYYVMGKWVKVPAEELASSPTLGREDLPGLPHHKKTGPKCICKGPVDLSTMSNGSTTNTGGFGAHNKLFL
jgi:hypothetical protein